MEIRKMIVDRLEEKIYYKTTNRLVGKDNNYGGELVGKGIYNKGKNSSGGFAYFCTAWV